MARLAIVVSGVVILAFVLLAAVAGLFVFAVLDRRSRALSPAEQFLDGLRRVETRVRQSRG